MARYHNGRNHQRLENRVIRSNPGLLRMTSSSIGVHVWAECLATTTVPRREAFD
jgi:hypothetical protein